MTGEQDQPRRDAIADWWERQSIRAIIASFVERKRKEREQ